VLDMSFTLQAAARAVEGAKAVINEPHAQNLPNSVRGSVSIRTANRAGNVANTRPTFHQEMEIIEGELRASHGWPSISAVGHCFQWRARSRARSTA
jgi:hypothetical protein